MNKSLQEKGPSILDLAQLALDVYPGPHEKNISELFNKNWVRRDIFPQYIRKIKKINRAYNPRKCPPNK